ncbi:cell division protein FtsZ [Microvirga sp. ACRRW]|uniref:cell division protein FtsZ n=1 Tax=Microvirga sp. ACRRW TaxID=2918205 RepID=UPI001EF59972|nr:cell division protein FtsZ [Microvirga sp. ACRRW]MCG7391696.1 cell division protein FtsZ [Microvirga sp. ACRRW]
MAINSQSPDIRELKPHITVFGVGGAGGNAVNNMIESGLEGVEFVVSNTDAQALASSKAPRVIQMGIQVTEGLGAGSQPEVGRAAAEEVIDEIRDQLAGSHMVFITAGMGGGTGTGAAPVVARAARELGILTVGVVTKPFQFEGVRRMKLAEAGIAELQQAVDTLIVIPNQNLFRVATEKTTFADAFAMADQVLYSGVACITDLMVKEGLINLDFADVRSVMRGMGKAMMGTGEASGEKRAIRAAEAAIANPLLDDVSMKGARGLLISITGGNDLTLYELDEAATRIREEVDQDANIILGATFDESLEGIIRVSVVATGIDHAILENGGDISATEQRISEVAERLRAEARARATHTQAVTQATPTFRANPQLAEPVKAAQHILTEGTPVLAPAPVAPQAMEPAPQPVVRDDVVLTPAQPKPAMAYEAPAPQAPVYDEPAMEDSFIPPQAERAMRPARMPRIDELPIPAQNQIRASRGEIDPVQEHKPSLIQRLATMGFGRREEAQHHAPAEQAPRQEAPRQQMSPVHAEYARRPAPQAQRPAQAPAQRGMEDDQLEIPAFLRRQAN